MSADWTGTVNGLAIGLGTPYTIAGLQGWRAMQALPLGGAASGGVTLPAPKPSANGSWTGPYWMPRREVTLLLNVTAEGSTAFATAVANLEAATQPQGSALPALTLQLDGVPMTVYGSFTGRDIPTEYEYQFGLTVATLQLECLDPRKFGADVSATTNLPHVSGGLTWPVTWPLSWPGTQDSGSVTITNPGNTNGPMRLRVDGPCTAPSITHAETGATLTLGTSAGLTVNAGDWLDIDCEARTVLYNGQVSRNGYLTSRGWFTFEPGDNTLGFNASGYNTSAQLTATGTPAWI